MMINEIERDKNGNRSWKTAVPPAIEPVSIDELKLFARIDGSEEDSLLTSFITEARECIEAYLNKALIEQTIELYMDYLETNTIELPKPPLISVTSFSTLDEDGVETVYDSTNYYVVAESIPGKIVIKSGYSLPNVPERESGGYKIVYKAGYGDTPNSVPKRVKQSILKLATLLYEKRIIDDEIPLEVTDGIRSLRVIRI